MCSVNELAFVRLSGTTTAGVYWELCARPRDVYGVGDLDRRADARPDAHLPLPPAGMAHETVFFRARGVNPLEPPSRRNVRGPWASFYTRTVDSRFLGVYYAVARPLCERPLFAQRGWRQRHPVVADQLRAQARQAADVGECVRPRVASTRSLVERPPGFRDGRRNATLVTQRDQRAAPRVRARPSSVPPLFECYHVPRSGERRSRRCYAERMPAGQGRPAGMLQALRVDRRAGTR
ncbi:m170 protein [Murid betaherpesvirus 1]|uniref:M170 protein n=1 Tax=Murid herpesvirus 1 TaxID=10366 RepID=H2A232_MUHV1|nr:m170 protein [Murid betaherpesvirus 1]